MAEDVSILQEIDDALRVDRAQEFWARYSHTILTFCALVVLCTALSELWKNHQKSVHERQTGKYAQAETLASDGKYGEAIGVYEQVEDDGGALATLAALRRAQALSNMKQDDKAIAALNTVADGKQGDAGAVFRDYAALQADILAHNQAIATGKPPVATAGVKDATGTGRIFASAFEEMTALRDPKGKDAQMLLTGVLAGKDAPLSQRMRAAGELDTLKGNAP